MSSLHIPTLLLANLLVALALVLIVMSTRVGLGAASRGMRTWLLGDVVLLVGQATTAFDVLPGWSDWRVPELTLSAGMVITGITLHQVAMFRHRQPARAPGLRWLLVAPALGGAVGLVNLSFGHPAPRAVVLNLALMGVVAFTIVCNLWPERRFLGVRVLIGALLFAVVANLGMLVSAAFHPEAVSRGAVTGLLLNLVMTMMTTSGFVLWLQEGLRESLRHAAQTDPLTGVLNRHGLLPHLRRELARAERQGPPLSVALCDIDHFKRINDTHGHAAGDEVLRDFADSLRAHARASDLVARWGGEEFLLVLPDTDAEAARRVVERIRTRRAAASPSARTVTFSAGVASTSGGEGVSDVDGLLARADTRLYAAKATRDTVVAA